MSKTILATAALLAASGLLFQATAQRGGQPDDVRVQAIQAPAHPLPPEADSARVTKFAFLVYGDTRSPGPSRSGEPPPDGREIQGPHTAVVDAMIDTTRALARTDFPVRFVVSSGDAVFYGLNGTMWNVSYVPVVNRLTRDAGLPFFFAPGNHDVTTRRSGRAVARAAREAVSAAAAAAPTAPRVTRTSSSPGSRLAMRYL